MSDLIVTQAVKLGEAFGMEAKGQELIQILKSIAFKGQVSDAQMAAPAGGGLSDDIPFMKFEPKLLG